jgi:hypothetical protein
MHDSNLANVIKESAQVEFPHGLLEYEMKAEAKYHLWRQAIKDSGKDNVVSFRTRDNPGLTK